MNRKVLMARGVTPISNPMRPRMEMLLIWAICAGFVVLFIAAVTLVWLNRSEKTLAPVVSILLVGTATTLVAVIVPLKETTANSEFATSVVLDTRDGRPPFEITNAPPNRPNVQLLDLFPISRPAVTKDGKPTATTVDPTNDNERITFASGLIQYRLIRLIQQLQRGGTSAGYSYGTSFATVTTAMKTSDSVDYSPAELTAAVASNRFANSDGETFHWQQVGFPVPPKTQLRLSSPSASGGQYAVILQKPMFFRITLTIETLPWTAAGVLPQGLSVRPDSVPYCQTYHFRVSMRAVFEKLTSGNYRTEEYKGWVSKLFDAVKDKLSE
jgi:hypothetical protein